jgi:hypothetical protein
MAGAPFSEAPRSADERDPTRAPGERAARSGPTPATLMLFVGRAT